MSTPATGPRTVEGKDRASRNATKHGMRSERPIVPGEDPAEWDAFRTRAVAELAPGSFLEREMAERVALQMWRLRLALLRQFKEERLARESDAPAPPVPVTAPEAAAPEMAASICTLSSFGNGAAPAFVQEPGAFGPSRKRQRRSDRR